MYVSRESECRIHVVPKRIPESGIWIISHSSHFISVCTWDWDLSYTRGVADRSVCTAYASRGRMSAYKHKELDSFWFAETQWKCTPWRMLASLSRTDAHWRSCSAEFAVFDLAFVNRTVKKHYSRLWFLTLQLSAEKKFALMLNLRDWLLPRDSFRHCLIGVQL